jgi:hypothetical protein
VQQSRPDDFSGAFPYRVSSSVKASTFHHRRGKAVSPVCRNPTESHGEKGKCTPWYIRTEVIAENNHSIPQMLNILLNSAHPEININSLYTFLWFLWKARNDTLFGRKFCKPLQVYPAANAIMQGSRLEDVMAVQDQHSVTAVVQQKKTQHVGGMTPGRVKRL